MNVSKITVYKHFGRDNGLGCLYRVDADWRAGYDAFDDVALPATLDGFVARAYPVLRLTPKGKWIEYRGERKFILNESHKRFACETVELAVKSFFARRERQISLLQGQLRRAEKEMARLKHLTADPAVPKAAEVLEETF
jgi:hypothetical protein